MTVDFGDEAIGDQVGLVDGLEFRSLVLRVGPIDVDANRDASRSRRGLHDRRLDAFVEQPLDVGDDVIAVVAERLALGVLTPGRVLGEQRTERVDVPSVERRVEPHRKFLVHDAILPAPALVCARRSADLATLRDPFRHTKPPSGRCAHGSNWVSNGKYSVRERWEDTSAPSRSSVEKCWSFKTAIKAPLNDRTFVVQVLVFLSMPEFQRPQECSISISCAENVHDLVLQEILLVCVVDKADDAHKCSEPDCLRSRFR